MDTARVIFTRRPFNPVSQIIRTALPRSIFRRAISSHCIIDLGNGEGYEAHMLHGVQPVVLYDALRGATVAAAREYAVPKLAAGRLWLEKQKDAPYDWGGAFGSADPDRDWQSDEAWYCYELAAAYLKACGLDLFHDRGHITEKELLGVNSRILLTLNQPATSRLFYEPANVQNQPS